MPFVPNRWEVYPKAPPEHFEEFSDVERLIVQVLYNRGIFEKDPVYDFLNSPRPAISAEAPQLKGIDTAVERILSAIEAKEQIIIYGDYDADGVTSTTLMVQALRSFGGNVEPYIPDRFEEGYGLNRAAIKDLADNDTALVITVDCGIRSADEVAYGNDLGLDFIITDHHQIPRNEFNVDILPPAVAVINPKRIDCHYPFKEFAGVGVAFKLVQALQYALSGSTGIEQDILDLVAIGTVADMAPLIGENRALVKSGLSYVNQARRLGLVALMEQSRLKPGEITAGKIGFTLGPRLNAAGRLTDAKLAYHLLSTKDMAEARDLAETLSQINIERQQMTETFVAQAREQVLADSQDAPLYLITDASFNHGVVGLVASRLAEEFYRPVFVAHRGDEVTKGSGRSIPEFDITRALDACADLLIKYGGHAAAAGFTVANENYDAFQTRLKEIAREQLADRELQRTLFVDAEINLRGVTYKLVEDIQALQPFGYSNPTPRFMTSGLTVRHQTVVGRDGNHLKMKLHDGKQLWDAIGFRLGQQWPPSRKLTCIDAVYTLELNIWQGVTRLQLNLKDIRPTDS